MSKYYAEYDERVTPYLAFETITPREIDSSGEAAEMLHKIRYDAAEALFAPLDQWVLVPKSYDNSYNFTFLHRPLGFKLERRSTVIYLTHSDEVIRFDPLLGIKNGQDHVALAAKVPALWEALKDAAIANDRSKRIAERAKVLAQIAENIEANRRRFNNPPETVKLSFWQKLHSFRLK